MKFRLFIKNELKYISIFITKKEFRNLFKDCYFFLLMNYAGIIIEGKDGKFLFQLRDDNPNIPNPNKWSIFGGGIELGESPRQAILRELKEELHLVLQNRNLRLLTVIPTFKKKNYIFYSRIDKNLSTLKLSEGNSMKYMSLKELIIQRNVVFILRLSLILYYLKSMFKSVVNQRL